MATVWMIRSPRRVVDRTGREGGCSGRETKLDRSDLEPRSALIDTLDFLIESIDFTYSRGYPSLCRAEHLARLDDTQSDHLI